MRGSTSGRLLALALGRLSGGGARSASAAATETATAAWTGARRSATRATTTAASTRTTSTSTTSTSLLSRFRPCPPSFASAGGSSRSFSSIWARQSFQSARETTATTSTRAAPATSPPLLRSFRTTAPPSMGSAAASTTKQPKSKGRKMKSVSSWKGRFKESSVDGEKVITRFSAGFRHKRVVKNSKRKRRLRAATLVYPARADVMVQRGFKRGRM